MSKKTDPQIFESGYERNRLDRYRTNPWMVKALVRELAAVRYTIPGHIWECAAGRGDMSRALTASGTHLVHSSDIDMNEFNDAIGPNHEGNFLDEFQVPDGVRSIVTNPPYNVPRGIADQFIRHGLGFFDGEIEFMAMLLRSEFRCGKTRKDMFGDCPHYMGELVLTTRPRWDYGDPDAPETAAPRHNFSWFLWYKNYRRQRGENIITPSIEIFSYMPKGFKP